MSGGWGTHGLADTGVACLVDAANEDGAGQQDVQAQVQQHVPGLAADPDGPGGTCGEQDLRLVGACRAGAWLHSSEAYMTPMRRLQ